MEQERSLNIVFVTSSGKKKTIGFSGAKEIDANTGAAVKALSNFIIQKNPIELPEGDRFVGLEKAYLEVKDITLVNTNI